VGEVVPPATDCEWWARVQQAHPGLCTSEPFRETATVVTLPAGVEE